MWTSWILHSRIEPLTRWLWWHLEGSRGAAAKAIRENPRIPPAKDAATAQWRRGSLAIPRPGEPTISGLADSLGDGEECHNHIREYRAPWDRVIQLFDGYVARHHGNPKGAGDLLRRFYETFEEKFNTADPIDAKGLLDELSTG